MSRQHGDSVASSDDIEDGTFSFHPTIKHRSDDTSKGSMTMSESGRSEYSSEQDEELLAKKETRAVFQLRVLVLLVLFLAAVAVSLVVYFITTQAEAAEFKAQYDGNAIKVLKSFQQIVVEKIGSISSLDVAFTSSARSKNDTWPYVTMNDFQQRAATARKLSDALFLEILPIVSDNDRLKYEKYSLENTGW
jgi:hypothetical protein